MQSPLDEIEIFKDPRARMQEYNNTLRRNVMGQIGTHFGLDVLRQLSSFTSACLLKRYLVKLHWTKLKKEQKDLLNQFFELLNPNEKKTISDDSLIQYLEEYLKIPNEIATEI